VKPFEIREDADAEALAAADWYESQAKMGQEFLTCLQQTIRAICADPTSHEQLGRGIRRRRVPRFPYDVIFRDKPDVVRILAVAHHHRQSEYWKRRS
jgi:hypothetical protein